MLKDVTIILKNHTSLGIFNILYRGYDNIIEELSKETLLQYAINEGIIDITYVQEKVEMNKRKELLERHPYKVWEGNNKKWYTYLPDEDKGRVQKERTNREGIENVVIEYWKRQKDNPTVSDVFHEWNNRRLELKKISSATHLRNTQVFNRHYKEFGNRKIKNLSQEDFEEFLEEQIPKFDLTAKAFSNLKSVTKGFLKRGKKRKLINFNVEELFQELDTSDTDFKKVIKEDYEEVFNEVEMPIIMDYLKNNLDIVNLSILLMFVTGIRVGELVVLKHDDFDGNTFKIRRTETYFIGEDGKYTRQVKEFPKSQAGVRTIIIPKDYIWIAKTLKIQNPFGEYIFVRNNGRRLTTQAVRERLEAVCKKNNIYPKSPHKIRKTYGSILLDNNIDNRLVLEQMGHADILCSEMYYHRNRRSIDKKSQIISNIPEFKAN